jgi:hypothetical protein
MVLDGHALTSFVMSARQQLPAAIKVILFELRSHAKAVLSGHAKASLPVAAPEPVLKLVEAPPVKEIVALRNFGTSALMVLFASSGNCSAMTCRLAWPMRQCERAPLAP